MKKLSPKIIIIVAIVVVLVLIAGGLLVHEDDSKWENVEYQNVKETFTVSGNIESLAKSIFKAPLTGKILKVSFEEGDNVQEGQILATYEKDSYEAQIDALNSSLYQAQQNYKKMASGNRKQDIATAKANYETQLTLLSQRKLEYEKVKNDELRNKDLFEKEMLTPQEYEAYIKDLEIAKTVYLNQKNSVQALKSQYELSKEGFRKEDILAAKGAVDNIKAQLKDIYSTYEKTDMKAPVSGKISFKNLDPGDNVQAGDMLFKIFNKSPLYVKALIEEEDIRNIKMNDTVKIVLDAYPNSTITGKITSIYDKVEESTRLLPVKIDILENKNNVNMLPGMTTSCTFAGHEVKYPTVPKNALHRDGKKYYVETKDGKVYLEVGKEYKDKVLVKGKLKASDKILVK